MSVELSRDTVADRRERSQVNRGSTAGTSSGHDTPHDVVVDAEWAWARTSRKPDMRCDAAICSRWELFLAQQEKIVDQFGRLPGITRWWRRGVCEWAPRRRAAVAHAMHHD